MRTPDTENALRALDDALAAGHPTASDPGELELQRLALAVRDESPEPAAEFTAAMDRRVAAGFPRPSRFSRLRLPRVPPLRIAQLGLGSAFAAVVVGAVLLGGGGGGDDEAGESAGGGGGDAAVQSAPGQRERADRAPRARDAMPQALEQRGSAPSTRVPLIEPPGADGIAPRADRRRIERSAALTLAAAPDRLDDVADRIVATVDRRGGFVLRSSVSSGEEGSGGGSFDLRVPAGDLRATLRELSTLATVRARSESGADITRGFVSTEDRLDAAQADRRRLLRRLAGATTEVEARAVRRRLNLTSAEIRGLRGQLRSLRERVTYATVSLTLVEKGEEGGGSAGPLGDAFDDFKGLLTGSLALALRLLGVLLPLALIAAAGGAAARALRRRRREAALS